MCIQHQIVLICLGKKHSIPSSINIFEMHPLLDFEHDQTHKIPYYFLCLTLYHYTWLLHATVSLLYTISFLFSWKSTLYISFILCWLLVLVYLSFSFYSCFSVKYLPAAERDYRSLKIFFKFF